MSAESASSRFRRMTGSGTIDIHSNQFAGQQRGVPTDGPTAFQLEKETIGGEVVSSVAKPEVTEEVALRNRGRLFRRTLEAIRHNPQRDIHRPVMGGKRHIKEIGIAPIEVKDEIEDSPIPSRSTSPAKPGVARLEQRLAQMSLDVQKQAKRYMQNPAEAATEAYLKALGDVAESERARQTALARGYQPVGKSRLGIFGGDSAVFTETGLAIFRKHGPGGNASQSNHRDGDPVLGLADECFFFEEIARGDVKFSTGARDTSRLMDLAQAALGFDQGSVVVTHKPTGRQFTLMGVSQPEQFCRTVLTVARSVEKRAGALKTIADLQAMYPNLFTTGDQRNEK